MRIARCGCGEITGVVCAWEGPADELVNLRWIPPDRMGSAVAARDADPWCSSYAEVVRVHRYCAQLLTSPGDDGERHYAVAVVDACHDGEYRIERVA